MEILFWLLGFIILVAIAKILGKSLSFILKLFANSLVGLILLLIFNLLAGIFGVSLEINFIHCLIVGFLGVGGIIILLIIQLL